MFFTEYSDTDLVNGTEKQSTVPESAYCLRWRNHGDQKAKPLFLSGWNPSTYHERMDEDGEATVEKEKERDRFMDGYYTLETCFC